MTLCLDCWRERKANAQQHHRTCRTCGAGFTTDKDWAKQCLPCWRDRRNGGQADDDLTRARERIKELEWELKAASRSTPGLDATMRRRLIQLCHPDKHRGSVASQEATKWLLKQ